MATPCTDRSTKKRYLGNSDPGHLEVHDLSKETSQCQINEFMRNCHAVTFNPDTLNQAKSEGYDNCKYCLGNSER